MTNDQPLFSIISFCKNRASTIRRSIESVLSQSYGNIEFLIQDGASTDGTVEIIRSYNDPRIKLVSEPDSGPAEGFWKVMNRCEGEFIGTCLSDEELLPGVLQRAVDRFRTEPKLGAITCDGYISDVNGNITGEFIAGEFNLVDYLFSRYCPFWPGSFFRRQALLDVGLKYHEWTVGCLEFEIWCRLGTQHSVKYVPGFVSKYTVDEKQLSNTPKNFNEHLDNRAVVVESLFSDEGFFGSDPVKKIACLYNQYYLFYNHTRAYKLYDQLEAIYHRMKALSDSLGPIEKLVYEANFSTDGSNFNERTAEVRARVAYLWTRVTGLLPRWMRNAVSAKAKQSAGETFESIVFAVYNYILPPWLYWRKKAAQAVSEKAKQSARETFESIVFAVYNYILPPWLYWRKKAAQQEKSKAIYGLVAPEYSADLYHHVAKLYYARGQIDQALQMWRKAEDLNDPEIDGIACQAMLLLPEATHEDLLKVQKRWANRHAVPKPTVNGFIGRPYNGDRKIRIGYHCAFMDSDTIRFIMSAVIKNHDRGKFEIYGYSATSLAADIESAFDTVRVTHPMSDNEFVKRVREDRIDIFVEMTGFSPLHRFGAMSARCAPVQISYLNHSGTSAVPNVDYILTDEISVLPGEDRFFTERVWRLPGCFLCYNYDMVESPPIADVAVKKNGHVTFGCFGSGGKINDQLIAIWAQVLKRVPNSRLYLRNYQLSTENNRQFMIDRFRRHGITTDRLKVTNGANRETILRSYDEVDISLDTWPYCGGNTVAESLWQGVPVVTLWGNRFSSRYGASILTAAGCADLVAKTPEEYVRLSVNLSRQPEKLTYYRKELRRMAKEFGLSDAEKSARTLERAYIEMMKRLHAVEAKETVALRS